MITREEFLEDCKDLPELIEISVDMAEPNSSIMIYEGDYLIKNENFEIQVIGTIKYDWLPNSGVHFYGKSPLSLNVLIQIGESKLVSIVVDGLEFFKGFITDTNYGNSELGASIAGISNKEAVINDRTISVNKLRFSIPNLRDFHGKVIKKITERKISKLSNRLILENDKYNIIIDKCPDFKERHKSLEAKGGYSILYGGELISKKGSITYTDTQDILYCLNIFLTFLNGRRTSALFISGVYENEEIWCDYTNYYVDSYKAVNSWPQSSNINGLNKIWFRFSELWQDKDNRNFLTSLIHWYVEANGHAGSTGGSIIIAQTALELLYNWWIVENRKLILGKDSENINAANKIRLLISQLNITNSVPDSLKHLKEYLNNSGSMIDAPDAIVQIRNAIVHSQEEKRKKLSEIHNQVKYEALQLSIWYIEISLLCILGFDDKYQNRCSGALYECDADEYVPWKKMV